MENGEHSPTAAEPANNSLPAPEKTKQWYRQKVWRNLEFTGLAMFPRPVYNRIPNFKGAQEAAVKLSQLDVFKNATTVKVNPDKPQEPVRVLCLEQKKSTYVPVPRLQTGFLSRLEAPEGQSGQAAIRMAVSRNGMRTYGKPITIEDTVSLDLVVMGSVAVSKEGFHIGKGRGYGDLEFGLINHMKAIKPNTVIVTTVHDCQVFDSMPAELFGPHDVPIDIIVTPTQVIETQRMSQRPSGILWHLLSNRKLSLMPVLGQLREIEMLAGNECAIKEVDTDVEDRAPRGGGRARRSLRRRTRSRKSQSEGEGNTTEGEEGKPARRRGGRLAKGADGANGGADGGANDGVREGRPRRSRRPKPVIDFSVKISNIGPSTRVRDLKQALSERGVKPQMMVWKGFRGFCYLHFFKAGPQKGEGEGAASDGAAGVESATAEGMQRVLAALAAMSVGGGEAEPRVLSVEPAPPRAPRQIVQPAPPAAEVH